MATGDIRNPRALHTHFRQDRPLLRIGPAATPFDACQNLLSHETPATDDAVNDVNNDRWLNENPQPQKAATIGWLQGDLLLDRFFLVTSLSWTKLLRHEVLAHYRERGKAEGHMGELKDVLAPALSSSNRAKSHLRGKKLKSRTPAIDAFACNEVRLLIACLAYQVMHIARRAMAKATGTGWSLRRLRERVLRAGARLVISGRRMTLALSSAAAPFWSVLWPPLMALHWADP